MAQHQDRTLAAMIASPEIRRTLVMIAIIAMGLVWLVEGPWPGRPAWDTRSDVLEIRVLDRPEYFVGRANGAALPPLYLASPADGWNPSGIRSIGTFTHDDDEHESDDGPGDAGWIFHVPMDLARQPWFRFEFTRGAWSTVELDANGGPVSPRRLDGIDLDALPWRKEDGRLIARLDLRVEGFLEQRGTRWPMGDAQRRAIRDHDRRDLPGVVESHELGASPLADQRTVRVWLPDGYDDPVNTDRRYPVLYMHDGQNLFDAETHKFGLQWGVDVVVSDLIERGIIEPWIVIGIDHGGALRVDELSPGEEAMPGAGGRISEYLAFLVDTVIPWAESNYRIRAEPASRALAGSSCGGNATMLAMLERPGVFSRLLVESPAMRTGDGVLIDLVARHAGDLPERVLIAIGTREYGAEDLDDLLLRRTIRLYGALRRHWSPGRADAPADLRLTIDPRGRHDEETWSRRLPGSLAFLLAP